MSVLYDDSAFVPTAAGSVVVTMRFLGVAAGPTNVTAPLRAGGVQQLRRS
jgi:hypothetical protein